MISTKTTVKIIQTYQIKGQEESRILIGKLEFPCGIQTKTLDAILESLCEDDVFVDGKLTASVTAEYEYF